MIKSVTEDLTSVSFPIGEGVVYTLKKEPIEDTYLTVQYTNAYGADSIDLIVSKGRWVKSADVDLEMGDTSVQECTITRKKSDVTIQSITYKRSVKVYAFYNDKSKDEIDIPVYFHRQLNVLEVNGGTESDVTLNEVMARRYGDVCEIRGSLMFSKSGIRYVKFDLPEWMGHHVDDDKGDQYYSIGTSDAFYIYSQKNSFDANKTHYVHLIFLDTDRPIGI